MKVKNVLKFQQHSMCTQLLSWFVARSHTLSYPISVLLITESWQWYRSGSINTLCGMLISWGNIWLTDKRSLIKRLTGG